MYSCWWVHVCVTGCVYVHVGTTARSIKPTMCYCARLELVEATGPEAKVKKAVLVIWSGPPLVLEADPTLESQSINIDCDEEEN